MTQPPIQSVRKMETPSDSTVFNQRSARNLKSKSTEKLTKNPLNIEIKLKKIGASQKSLQHLRKNSPVLS